MKAHKFKVAICAIVRNEALYLLDWLAFHRSIGVQHFVIYEHQSTDETALILKALENAGVLSYFDWNPESDFNPQHLAYRDGLKRMREKTDWLGFIDLDEYVVLHDGDNLYDYLMRYKDFTGVCLNWKIFGSSGQQRRTEGMDIERFLRCSNSSHESNRHVKTFARPELIKKPLTHIPHLKSGKLVDTSGREVSLGSRGIHDSVHYNGAQLNHYFCRSREEWQLKRARGRSSISLRVKDRYRPESLFDKQDVNDEEDRSALRFLPAARKERERLAALLREHS